MKTGRNEKTLAARKPSASSTHDPLGDALRVAYRRAVEEPIPDEILDLLAKLR